MVKLGVKEIILILVEISPRMIRDRVTSLSSRRRSRRSGKFYGQHR
ncbi:hypothetical protein [Halomicronema sp. CCY15110]|nr:hypothetical protein [Halomicronema sp. CCY15110]